ncbi:hypothetical protein BC629DRAFT_1459142 [Irpex lacteus]|nr:hypothetical protein BC629DRAFT_1459142 [Irpex lacteus]
MSRTLLTIGLALKNIADPALLERIRKGVEALNAALPKAGYDATTLQVQPVVGSQDVVDALTSRKWDAVIIGFGVRGNPEHTVFFEWLVNAVKEKAPQAKIGFNVDPESTLDCAKRLVPVQSSDS